MERKEERKERNPSLKTAALAYETGNGKID
jgi:hypothetical protein